MPTDNPNDYPRNPNPKIHITHLPNKTNNQINIKAQYEQ